MEIKLLENIYTSENTYIVINGNEALVIDPSYELSGIINAAGGARITHILLTHCHYDHIGTLDELREFTGAKVISSEKCSVNIGDTSVSLREEGPCAPADITPADGELFSAAGIDIKIIYTPGHTNGSACYHIGDVLFSGDTVFLRSVGRSDLPTGNTGELEKSIKNKIYDLPDDTVVYPGHGRKTSVGYEKKFNFFVKG